jgi:hypothetical protein
MKGKLIESVYFLIALIGIRDLAISQPVFPGIPIQAIAKDLNNNPVKKYKIHIQSNLLFSKDSQLIYSEEFETQTDDIGVFQIIIGQGIYKGGVYTDLQKIPWAKLTIALGIKIAIPPTVYTPSWNYQDNWIDVGISPFGFVPYAMYALQPNTGVSIKSKGRSNYVHAADSIIIELMDPLDTDDGLAVSMEVDRSPTTTPSFYLQRDCIRNKVIVFFTAPFSGYITWIIID